MNKSTKYIKRFLFLLMSMILAVPEIRANDFSLQQKYAVAEGNEFTIPLVGDLDGDGLPEIVCYGDGVQEIAAGEKVVELPPKKYLRVNPHQSIRINTLIP
jgi:hypothetical protein